MHDWVLANENMAKALAAKHYQFVFARNAGNCDARVKQQTLPAALQWLWKGYPLPRRDNSLTDAADGNDRSKNGPQCHVSRCERRSRISDADSECH